MRLLLHLLLVLCVHVGVGLAVGVAVGVSSRCRCMCRCAAKHLLLRHAERHRRLHLLGWQRSLGRLHGPHSTCRLHAWRKRGLHLLRCRRRRRHAATQVHDWQLLARGLLLRSTTGHSLVLLLLHGHGLLWLMHVLVVLLLRVVLRLLCV